MKINLIPFTKTDFPELIQWIQSPELMIQWAGPFQFNFPLDETQLENYLQTSYGENPIARIYKVVSDRGEAAGIIELGMIRQENGTASICRVFLAPEFRGKHICHEMIRLILKIGFNELHLHRIDLRVYSFNTPAIKCYEAAGMVREGVLRKSQRVGDRYWDTVLMAILREEWEQKQDF